MKKKSKVDRGKDIRAEYSPELIRGGVRGKYVKALTERKANARSKDGVNARRNGTPKK